MTIDWATWSLGFAVGAMLGAVYFGGLWLIAWWVGRSRRPSLWLLASLPVRLAAAASAFYVVLVLGDWRQLIAALIGFIVVRQIAVARARHGLGGAP